MADYDDTNKGVLFRESEKESEKHPDMTGKLNVEGKEYRLAGWTRESKNGKKFLSLAVSELSKGKDSSSWQAARNKFKREVEERGDDSAKREVVLDDDEPISLADIPF